MNDSGSGSGIAEEVSLHCRLLRLEGQPYRFGGRGYGGIDCSSLIVKGVRDVLRARVADLPWMTADQLAKGWLRVTKAAPETLPSDRCLLAFLDWDEDSVFEHAAVRLLDGSWIWSSSSAGRVVRVSPETERVFRRQWLEIAGAIDSPNSTLRVVDWMVVRKLR